MKTILVMLSFCGLVVMGAPSAAGQAEQDKAPASGLTYSYQSPLVAGALSIIPGLGQMYNGDYAVGGIALAFDAGLYLAAAAYAGLLDPDKNNTLTYESAFLLAAAIGVHLFCFFDATMEASRRNENLDRWSVMIDPQGERFALAYRLRF
ncbi:MAG TPA: hypothetical protein VM425_09005 [Myxococcota bacterium]|nr:hypothetical protein [Myxococcota bacterium]